MLQQWGKTSALLLGILLAVAVPRYAAAQAGVTGSTMNVVSKGEDEFIGRGKEYHLANARDGQTGSFFGIVTDGDNDGQVDYAQVNVADLNIVTGSSRLWTFIFTTTAMKKPLKPGTYNAVVEPRKATATQAGLDIGAYGRGCGADPQRSAFTINDIKVQLNSTTKQWELVRLSASFKFSCGQTDAVDADKIGLTGDLTIITGVAGSGQTPGGGSDGGGGTTESADVTVVIPELINEEGLSMVNSNSANVDFSVATTSAFNEPVFLSAVSDPEGLDVSVTPSMLPAPGRGDARLSIRTGPTTFPRDYRVDVIATTSTKVYSSSMLVRLTCDPPLILGSGQPHNGEVSRGNVATLDVTAAGSPPFTYQWYSGYSGQTSFPIAGATGRTFTTSGLTDTGYYWARVTNACGSIDSQTATVTVRAPASGTVPRF